MQKILKADSRRLQRNVLESQATVIHDIYWTALGCWPSLSPDGRGGGSLMLVALRPGSQNGPGERLPPWHGHAKAEGFACLSSWTDVNISLKMRRLISENL